MNIKSVNDEFWIIEENGVKLGNITKIRDVFVVSNKNGTYYINDPNVLDMMNNFKNEIQYEYVCYGYPTNVIPYKLFYDVRLKLPLFKKSDKSGCYFCAGYYLIKNKIVFCPKLLTLESNKYSGPFKSIDEVLI